MTTILIVDDVAADQVKAGALLEEHHGWTAVYADDGREALEIIEKDEPDLVLTDLQMPEINGLELVKAIHKDRSHLPVILMTAYGSEDIAVAALKAGAASYVPKHQLAVDLVKSTEGVLELARTSKEQKEIFDNLLDIELRFELTNDSQKVRMLISHLQNQMKSMELTDKAGQLRIGTVLHEALVNAIEHGNLELSSDLREGEYADKYRGLVKERCGQQPYCDRKLLITVRLSREQAVFVIRDEGLGFDTSKLPDPREPANLQKCTGRGLFLIRTFMDEVSFNDKGNEITIVKRLMPAD